MPLDLTELLDPDHTAVVTSEVQRGVVGEGSALPELAKAAEPVIANIARLVTAARAASVPVDPLHGVAPARTGSGPTATPGCSSP